MGAVGLLPQQTILQEWWQEVKDNCWEKDAKNKIIALLFIHELDCGKEYYRFLLLFGYRTGTYSGTS